jgi:hypothetical protein
VDESKGYVYVADQNKGGANEPEVFRCTTGGIEAESTAGPGAGTNHIPGFGFSAGEGQSQIAVSQATHEFYVADTFNFSVKAFDEDGEPALFSAGPGAGTNELFGISPCGVAIDAAGDIYVAEEEGGPGSAGAITVYGPTGAELTSFEAGTVSPLAGSYSPFVVKLTRENGSQQLRGLNLTLPPGLTGKLAGLKECSDPQIAAAERRSNPGQGALEKTNPSCPAGSEIGVVNVGAGSGSPLYVQGHAYLAGPYKGAPLSMVIITPAVAGPFDLGVVVVRAALFINESTAQITVKSDPIPTILDGIPLDIRSIAVNASRNEFTLNPTSCNAMSVLGTATSTLGQAAQLSNRFQVGGCKGLDYAPKLHTRLYGPTRRGAFPKLRAIVEAGEGEANSSRLAVTLPHSEFLEQGHFKTICTRVQFAANACPAKSVYGHVKVYTPLLSYPLEGPAYLRSSSHNLPDLVLVLRGPAYQPIELVLDMRIDSKHKGIRTTFEGVPDAPFAKAILYMQGGKKGLLVNSKDICAGTNRSLAKMTAQNGKAFESKPVLKNSKCSKHKKKSGHGKKKNGGKHKGKGGKKKG